MEKIKFTFEETNEEVEFFVLEETKTHSRQLLKIQRKV